MARFHNVLALGTAVALFGCSSAQEDWSKASAAGTIPAYQDYLNKHPTGEHSTEANDRMHSLQDDAAWSQAKQANTLAAYRNYEQQQPNGAHLQDAQNAVTAAQRAADWKSAESAGTVPALQDFLKKYTEGTEVDAARAKLADITGFKVQLASVKTQKQAQREQEKLRAKYVSVLHEIVVVPNHSGSGYALVSTPMSQTQADSACSELKKTHQSCEVIKNDSSTG
jgi:SPOR domain